MTEQEAPRQLILAFAGGLDREVFAIMNDRGAALVAGITEADMRPGVRMRPIVLDELTTLYWGDLDDLCHRVRGALQDAVENPGANRMVAIPEGAMEDGVGTGNPNLDQMLAQEPGFREVLRQCFRAREAKLDRKHKP